MALSPRTQIVYVSICCVLLVAGSVVYAQKQKKTHISSSPEISTTTNSAVIDETGSDEWKEQFINTKTTDSKTSTNSTSTTEDTLTNQLGRNFFVNYIGLKQKDLLDDDAAIQSVVDELIYSTVLSAPEAKIYSILDLKLIQTNDLVAIKEYGNKMANAFSMYGPKRDVIEIAKDALESANMNILNQIDPVITDYANTVNALLAIEVPYEYAAFHLQLINALSESKFVSEGLKKIAVDPAMSLIALNGYVSSRQDIYNSLMGIKNLFTKKGIYFQANEPGALFSTII